MSPRKIEPISRSIDVLRRQLGIAPPDAFDAICEEWPMIIGSMLASKSAPAFLKGGSLYITVSDPAVAEEIHLRKGHILAAVTAHRGDSGVRDVVVRLRPR